MLEKEAAGTDVDEVTTLFCPFIEPPALSEGSEEEGPENTMTGKSLVIWFVLR